MFLEKKNPEESWKLLQGGGINSEGEALRVILKFIASKMARTHGDFKQDSSGNLVSIRRGYKAVHIIVNRPVLILN